MSLTQTVNTNNPNSSGLPQSLIYDTTLPRGFASSFKRWEVNPQTSFNVYNPTDTIRFIIETQDYIDPYSSYLEIEVEFNPLDYIKTMNTGETSGSINTAYGIQTPPIFMLDGPSTSLISQLIIYSNAREVERIQEYDQIGNLIKDLHLDIGEQWFKPHEGFQLQRPMSNDNSPYITPNGGASIDTLNPYAADSLSTVSTFPSMIQGNDGTNPDLGLLKGQRYYLPGDRLITVGGYEYQRSNTSGAPGEDFYGPFNNGLIFTLSKLGPYGASMFYGKYITTTATSSSSCLNFAMQKRQGYTTEFIAMDGGNGVQGTISAISGTWGNVNMAGGAQFKSFSTPSQNTLQANYGRLSENSHGYGHAYGTRIDQNFAANRDQQIPQTGFIRPFSAGSALNYGQYFAPTMVKHTIYNGCFINYLAVGDYSCNQLGYEPIILTDNQNTHRFRETRKTFYIPILSGVLGTLIPSSQWKLIPGAGCGQLLFEWRFNPHAFFASGPNFDGVEMYNGDALKGAFNTQRDQYQIKYRFTKCSMKFDLWNFGPSVDQYLSQQHPNGIYMTSRMFTQGPTYQVPSSSAATNSWQINNGIQSLRQIYFYFLSNEYQTYNWCRKNFRCSRNLTSIQLKIGQNYIPQTGPIIGHAGQLFKNSIQQLDYTPFLLELHRSCSSVFLSGKHQLDPQPPNITPEQFVVDQRPYEPYKLMDIGFGNALFHETRCRGQALYTIDLLSDPFDETVLTGIDTKQYRPIELITKSAGDIVSNPTPTTMYIFLYHDLMVRFSADGIYTAGYG